MERLAFVDLFCGIGGFRVAAENVCRERNIEPVCVFSSDIDPDSQTTYEANFGERPAGDIREVESSAIPDHDIIFSSAVFPVKLSVSLATVWGLKIHEGRSFLKSLASLPLTARRGILEV